MELKRNGQAITELAVLGIMLIIAFSFLINYSEKLNRQQANIQKTFRAALAEAKKINNSVYYTKKAFFRLPNVSSPKELGQFESFSDNSSIIWSDGKDRDNVYVLEHNPINNKDEWRLVGRYGHPGLSKYQFNDIIQYVIKDNATGNVTLSSSKQDIVNKYDSAGNLIVVPQKSKGTVTSTDSYTNVVDATTTLTQNTDTSGNIVTRKSLTATDTLTADVDIEGKSTTFTHTLGPGGKYSSGNNSITR